MKRMTVRDYKPAQLLFHDLASTHDIMVWAEEEKEQFIKTYFEKYNGGAWTIPRVMSMTVANIKFEIMADVLLMFGSVASVTVMGIKIDDSSVRYFPNKKDDSFTCKIEGNIQELESSMAILRLGIDASLT